MAVSASVTTSLCPLARVTLVELAALVSAGANAVTVSEEVAVAWLKCPSPAYVAVTG